MLCCGLGRSFHEIRHQNIHQPLTGKVAADELAALNALSAYSHTEIPAPLAGIDKRPVRFTKTVDVCDMPADVLSFAE